MIYFHEIGNLAETIENEAVLSLLLIGWIFLTDWCYRIWFTEKKSKTGVLCWGGFYFVILFLNNSTLWGYALESHIPLLLLILETVIGAMGVFCYRGDGKKKGFAAGLAGLAVLIMQTILIRNLQGWYSMPSAFLSLEQLILSGFLFWTGYQRRKEGKNTLFLYLTAMSALPLLYVLLYISFLECDLFRVAGYQIKDAAIAAVVALDLATVFLFWKMQDCAKQEEETQMLQEMVAAYSNQIALMQESRQRVKGLQHDLKHHLVEMQNMIKAGENEKLLVYMQEMEQFLLNPDEYCATGNASVDTMLNYMLEKAEKDGCHVETKLQIPENWYEGSFSFCAILGNLLDNAIRETAWTKEKSLFVGLCEKQGVLMIQVKNSCRNQAGKKIPGEHGYGLENVKRIVESLDGEFTQEQGEGWYEANVMLYSRTVREKLER